MNEQTQEQTQERTGNSGEVGFATLVLMFSTAAMIHLGAAPDPVSGKTQADLARAKQMIDLRMRYLEAVERA